MLRFVKTKRFAADCNPEASGCRWVCRIDIIADLEGVLEAV